jgi:cellulose synthase operon protein YhjQ
MMTLVCFTSPKGGVGKTTLAANVANELSRAGVRVVALDLDPQNALRLYFGLPLEDADGFTHALPQHPDWRRCLHRTASGVSVLPYGASKTSDALSLAAAVAEAPVLLLQPVLDILADPDICVVLDTAPGESSLLAALLPRIDLLINVLLVDAASVALIPGLKASARCNDGAAAEDSSPATGFILNQFDPRTRLGRVIADAAALNLGSSILGVVYRDEFVGEAIASQMLVSDYAPASKAAVDIAQISQKILSRLQAFRPGQVETRDRRFA